VVDGRFVVLVGVAVRGREPRLPSGALRTPRRRWEPVAWVGDVRVADAMVELLQEETPDGAACVVHIAALAATVGSAAAEMIKDRLRNPTVVEIQRARDLQQRAEPRSSTTLGSARAVSEHFPERRSGRERRSVRDRRRHAGHSPVHAGQRDERRKGERRSGHDRRSFVS
jgi:hypothetical protein